MQGTHWVIAAESRMQHAVEGATMEYPGRLATCPKGHVRVVPTRFSRDRFDLRCEECRRSYPFTEPR